LSGLSVWTHTRADVNLAFMTTLGAELERDRLARRARRIAMATVALRERGREPGAMPRRLQQAIADFEAQVEEMNARLAELERARAHASP
jgi:hypothetical protein